MPIVGATLRCLWCVVQAGDLATPARSIRISVPSPLSVPIRCGLSWPYERRNIARDHRLAKPAFPRTMDTPPPLPARPSKSPRPRPQKQHEHSRQVTASGIDSPRRVAHSEHILRPLQLPRRTKLDLQIARPVVAETGHITVEARNEVGVLRVDLQVDQQL